MKLKIQETRTCREPAEPAENIDKQIARLYPGKLDAPLTYVRCGKCSHCPVVTLD
jgi:hypothetical protein